MTTMFFHTNTEQKIDFSFENGQVTLYGDISSVAGRDVIYGVDKANPLNPPLYYFKLTSPVPSVKHPFDGSLTISVEYYIYDFHPEYNEIVFSFPALDLFLANHLMGMKITERQKNCHEDGYQCSFDGHNLRLQFNAEQENTINNYNYPYVRSGKLSVKSEQNFDANFAFLVVERIRGLFSFIYSQKDISIENVILKGHHEYLRPINICQKNGNNNLECHPIEISSILYSQETYNSSTTGLETFYPTKYPTKYVDFSIFKGNIKELIQMAFDDKIIFYDLTKAERNEYGLKHTLWVNYCFEYYFEEMSKNSADKIVSKRGKSVDVCELRSLRNKLFYIYNPIKLKGNEDRCFNERYSKTNPIKENMVERIVKGNENVDNGWKGLEIILKKYLDEPYCGISFEKLIDLYIKFRNAHAHGAIVYELKSKDYRHIVHSIRFVECMNYCLVLKLAGYADGKISCIIDNYWMQLSILSKK